MHVALWATAIVLTLSSLSIPLCQAEAAEGPGAVFGAEATGDFLPQLHHPPILLREFVGEGHPRTGEESEHVLLALEAERKVVANPSWPPSARFISILQ